MMQHPTGEVGVCATEAEAHAPQAVGVSLLGQDFKPFPVSNVLEELFTYHAPTGDQPERYKRIRSAAKFLAYVIHNDCAPGPDRTAAVRKISEAVMTANKSIATNNAQYR
jgi:hypothetical protein